MAIRLPVIITQSESRDQRASDIEESLVAELIMADGLDATLVGPLVRLLPDSTDMLCLKGFTHDLALLGWMPIEQADAWWRANGMTGVFVPLQGAGATSASGKLTNGAPQLGRRIAYLQLEYTSDPGCICDSLRARLHDMRIKPIPIQLAMPKTGSPTGVVPLPVVPSSSATPAVKRNQRTTVENTIVASATPSVGKASSQAADDDEWPQLDRLVDDLDALDL
jgi:hypothetical protein